MRKAGSDTGGFRRSWVEVGENVAKGKTDGRGIAEVKRSTNNRGGANIQPNTCSRNKANGGRPGGRS